MWIQPLEESLYAEPFHLVLLTWIKINNKNLHSCLLKGWLEYINILLCFLGLNFKLSNTKLQLKPVFFRWSIQCRWSVFSVFFINVSIFIDSET